MRIPDSSRKCVAYVEYTHTRKGATLAGTAFFMTAPITATDAGVYAVTAKHVLDVVRSDSKDGQVRLAVNTKSGGVAYAASHVSDWTAASQDDEAIDAAITPIGAPRDFFHVADLQGIPLRLCATSDLAIAAGVGVGDDVFLTGLFSAHPGRTQVRPIVRVGAIAAMPEERVVTRLGLMSAYLVESRSVGGLSGSPVYVYVPAATEDRETGLSVLNRRRQILLLGLVHGSYSAQMAGSAREAELVNMGIAIVVPIERVLELINSPAQQRLRDEAVRRTSTARDPA